MPITSPPIDVDEQDQDAGDRVAADELRGTVHRAVEVGFVRDLGAPRLRASSSPIRPAFRSASIAICLPGIASSVNRAVTSAIRPAPLVMTTKLITSRIVNTTMPTAKLPPTRKLAERLDHLAGGVGAGVTVQQHGPRRRDVERQAQQRGQQQHRREHREVERPHRVIATSSTMSASAMLNVNSKSSSSGGRRNHLLRPIIAPPRSVLVHVVQAPVELSDKGGTCPAKGCRHNQGDQQMRTAHKAASILIRPRSASALSHVAAAMTNLPRARPKKPQARPRPPPHPRRPRRARRSRQGPPTTPWDLTGEARFTGGRVAGGTVMTRPTAVRIVLYLRSG